MVASRPQLGVPAYRSGQHTGGTPVVVGLLGSVGGDCGRCAAVAGDQPGIGPFWVRSQSIDYASHPAGKLLGSSGVEEVGDVRSYWGW